MKRFLSNVFYRKIWIRIAVIFTFIALILMGLLGVLLINASSQAVTKSVLASHEQIVTRAASEIGLFIKKPTEILRATAAMLGRRQTDSWEEETLLVELVLNQPSFLRAFTVDTSGRGIASSEMTEEVRLDYPQEALDKVKKGGIYVSEVRFLDNHTPFLSIAVPVTMRGEVIRSLIAEVSLRQVWKTIDDIKLDRTGEALLVCQRGIVIASADKKRVLANQDLSGEEVVRRVLEGETGARELRGTQGKQWVVSYAPIREIGWGVILRQEQPEAYRASHVMKIQSFIILFLIIVLAIIASIVVAKLIARPLERFTNTVRRTAAGSFKHKMNVKRRDEIGDLVLSFNDMVDELEKSKTRERFSVIGEATTWVVHELKNSLVAIKAFIQLFPLRYKDTHFINKFKELIPEEIKRWENMLREISDFSSNPEIKKTKTDLRKLIQDVLVMMDGRFKKNKVRVSPHIFGDNLQLMADAEKLKQVFINLMVNAVNAMADGGVLSVSAQLKTSSDTGIPPRIEVHIRDTGKGISAQEMEKIFEPFYTTKKEGMGLGLTISRKIVEQHRGTIEVKSRAGTGTTFTIILPVTDG